MGSSGCGAKGGWPGCSDGKGTLFRLPFRTQAVADKSKIKLGGKAPTIATVKEHVVGPFRETVMQRLLFLKSIELIEIWVWEEGQEDMKLEGRWDVAGWTADADRDRKALMRHVINCEKELVKHEAAKRGSSVLPTLGTS